MGFTVPCEKCAFLQPSLKYLDQLIVAKGIHFFHDKIKTLPTSSDAAQLSWDS